MAERKTRDINITRRIAPAANDEEEKAGKVARSPSADTGGGRFVRTASSSHSRRERQARRRVQPLGEDESEEARDRGVPVPPVGLLPETKEVRVHVHKCLSSPVKRLMNIHPNLLSTDVHTDPFSFFRIFRICRLHP